MGKLTIKNSDKTLLQITDTHILADKNATLLGVNTYQALSAVMDKILVEEKSVDAVLLTGDLSQHGEIESYEHLPEFINRLNFPVYFIPGNHDDPENMRKVFAEKSRIVFDKNFTLGNWAFILLNSRKAGMDAGFLAAEELQRLKDFLSNNAGNNINIAIVLHHHPVEIKTPLIDKYILQNAEDFWNILEQYNRKFLILCGHVHGDYQIMYKNHIVETCPASCFQWSKHTHSMKIEKKIGYKVYKFSNNFYSTEAKIWDF